MRLMQCAHRELCRARHCRIGKIFDQPGLPEIHAAALADRAELAGLDEVIYHIAIEAVPEEFGGRLCIRQKVMLECVL